MAAPRFHEVFSPTIMETTVSNKFLNIINETSDGVLSDKKKSIKYDWSHKLVGKVRKEIQIPITDKEEKEYCLATMKQACLDYLNFIISKNRAYNWGKIAGDDYNSPTLKNIHLAQSWVVSQYKHEYNPWHTHSGDFSAVMYLKIPDDMENHFEEEKQDHYPASGLIDFKYGEKHDFRSDTLMMKPEVGMMMVFPSWLNHSVYPFYCDGERRSMSFNSFMKAGEKRVAGVNTI